MERLQEGLAYNLVLISAPAGFGKTTVLSEWARQSQPKICTAWVSLDEGDNEPVRFWEYLIAAIKTLQSDFGERPLALLRSPQPTPIEPLLTILINELDNVQFQSAIVLDDYHFIRSMPVHSGINYLIEHMPQKTHLIIASRIDPPLPLVHYRGKGMMLEISSDDLRFTHDEAATLLKELKSPSLAISDIDTLNARTEGWAVGLKMAALSLRRQPDVRRFITSFTGSQRYIMDYLMEEVLKQQPHEIRDFLLKTSVLERLTAPLCDFVTGRHDSQEMILRLENDNLFIVPLDESRQWYRYEHLFAELLRHQLEIEFGLGKVSGWHRLACQWHEEHQFSEDAIHHALEAKDWETAMRLINDPRLTGRGEWVILLNWLKQIPEETLRTNIPIYLLYIRSLLGTGQLNAAEAPLKYLEESTQDNRLQGSVAALRTLQALIKGDTDLIMEYGKTALALLPPADIATRSYVCLMVGMDCINRYLYAEAEPLLAEAYDSFRKIGNNQDVILPLTFLGLVAMVRGKLNQAAKMYRQVIDLDERSNSTTYAHILLSFVLYEWNELGAATSHLERAIELNRPLGDIGLPDLTYLQMARIRLAQGDFLGAKQAMEKADRLLTTEPGISPFNRARNAAYHVMLAIAQKNTDAVSRWLDKLSEYEVFLPPDGPLIAIRALYVRRGKNDWAERLQADEEMFARDALNGYLISVHICQAMESSTPAEALRFLSDALAMAKPEGCIRAFVDEGMALAQLLRQAISQKIEPGYAAKLLTIIEAEEERHKLIKGKITLSPAHEILSGREIEVLRLLATGYSNQQIAEKLLISLSTAKTHVHHLFEKLNVKDRVQAIVRAQELGLI